jgi:3-oxoacyl-[acyl-carrier-protein] synthase II
MTAYTDINAEKKRSNRKRVVITGFGAVTPLGNNIAESWQSLIQGKSGIGPITVFDAARYPVKIAAEVKNFNFHNGIPEDLYPFLGRSTQFCIHAAREALKHAGLDTKVMDTTNIGISLGSHEEGMYISEWEKLYASKTIKEHIQMRHDTPQGSIPYPHLQASTQLGQIWTLRKAAHTAANILSILFNIQGPVRTSTGACASSAQAIGKAMRLIQDSDAEVVLTGGCDSMLCEFSVAGFHRLRALSHNNDSPEKASRPFDLNRDGFVLGEGSGILVLEELSHAKKRNATIYGEMMGYGSSSNAYSITASPEDGRGADICMKAALRDAGCSVEDVDYINAHGTSTYLNDKSETAAIKNVFKDRAYEIPVSSNKSMLGHLIASAAAIELIMSVMTINEKVIPPTINYETPDPECDLDYVPNQPRSKKVETILSNSFAFGGQNASVLVQKYQ